MIHHLTNFLGPQVSHGITKLELIPVPIIDTISGTREKRIFYLFNHFSKDIISGFDSIFGLSLKYCQPLESANLFNYQATMFEYKQSCWYWI